MELLIQYKAIKYHENDGSTLNSEDRIFLAQFYDDNNDPTNWTKSLLAAYGVKFGNLVEVSAFEYITNYPYF